MDFLYIDKGSVELLASNRFFQSADFDQSEILINFLEGDIRKQALDKMLFLCEKRGGFILSENGYNSKNALIFDFNKFEGFNNTRSDSEKITIFQKILKFSIRFWQKLPLTTCEKNIQDSELSIVFPFSFTLNNAYRVVIDRNPDSKRIKSRGGSYLLVFDDSYGGTSSTPVYSNFRKAIEQLPNVDFQNTERDFQSQISPEFAVSVIEGYKSIIDPNIGFDTWKHLLTNSQKEFVYKMILGPERLEGAAGTGKTLSLILRTVHVLKEELKNKNEKNLLFITHSIASKNQIISIFKNNFPGIESYFDRNNSSVSIEINTLQEWCISFLGRSISENEYLDKDAQDSKIYQSLYIEEALSSSIEKDFPTFKKLCSENFINFIENTPIQDLVEMFQLEIAVTIKGRASDDKDKYMSIRRNNYSIPIENEGDYNFSFLIFQKYQNSLAKTGQFDSDDIVLSVLSQLNTPLWRRRKEREGYDAILIDETHLFNFNELSVFHSLLKDSLNSTNIVFVFDKSQAVGDRGLSDYSLNKYLSISSGKDGEIDGNFVLNTVFRSSPAIINLAYNVLSSGNSLFDGFQNPLEQARFSFTESEERKTTNPKYMMLESDDQIIEKAFEIANSERQRLNSKRSDIAIISTSELLLHKLEAFAQKTRKPYELIKRRGDLTILKLASETNRFVLAGIDYIGGLEFSSVIIVGVDKGRVPPTLVSEGMDSYHFLNYSWHNRMYVGITRAKFSVFLIGEKSRGQSKILEKAINAEVIEFEEV